MLLKENNLAPFQGTISGDLAPFHGAISRGGIPVVGAHEERAKRNQEVSQDKAWGYGREAEVKPRSCSRRYEKGEKPRGLG